MTTVTRPLVRRLAAALSGGVLLAAAAGAALAGEVWPVEQTAVDATEVPVAATAVAQVCPGPPRLATAVAGEDLGYDEFDPEGSGTRSALDVLTLGREDQPPGGLQLLPTLAAAEAEDVTLSGAARLAHRDDVGEAAVLRAEPSDGTVAFAAGTSVALTETGDLRGLTAASCQPPATSAWLVGGSTEPGNSAQLVLSNAGDTPASATLTGWGSTGPLDLSTAGAVLVPPGGQRVVLLESLSADPRPAVHVEVTGGEVTAVVQDSRLRGLVPAGTDLISPGTAPARTVVLPGIFLGETSGEGADAPAVRIVNPGEEPVTARLELLGADGVTPVPGADALVVDPGAVVDVSLEGMPLGAWTAVVSADGPVTGAAVVTTVGRPGEDDPGTAPVDRAWVPATAGVSSGLVAVPAELVTRANLVVANPSSSTVEVELVPVLRDGTRAEPVSRTLGARTSLLEDVSALAEDVAAVEVQAREGAVHATLMLTATVPDGGLMSAVPLTEDPHAARAVTLAPAPAPLG
ncbi:DUF5719 family protein [Georgenia sp. H159]|uniref:DUF5719 family protein n=1 Tax=Georgenia sp. H159 TaxID=3076115 RepID=UPI002D77D87E|nr:DUF5719 family protein [Georgenia sp. H159]